MTTKIPRHDFLGVSLGAQPLVADPPAVATTVPPNETAPAPVPEAPTQPNKA
jgi:hypothetical protein